MPFAWTLGASAPDGAILIDLLLILTSAGFVALVTQRLKLETVPAYLLAGACLGPSALGLVTSPDSLAMISHLAMILLMFGIGLHMDLSMMKSGAASMVGAGLLSFAATTMLGWGMAISFGLTPAAALAVSLALSMSSTAVVMRVLAQRRELRRPVGRLSFAVLLIQDLLVVGVLAALPALARWGGAGGADIGVAEDLKDDPFLWMTFLQDAARKVGGVAALIVIGRLLLPRLLREAAKGHSREVMLVLSVAAAIGAALATAWLGFSPELGAFLAGLILASTPFKHQLAGQISPLRDLLIAVFFTTVGMKVDVGLLADWWWLAIVATAATLAVKSVGIAIACWAAGAAAATSFATGLALCQAGEFSLVLLDVANGLDIIGPTTLANTTAVVALSLIVTPSLMRLGSKHGSRFASLPAPPWIKVARFTEEGDPHAPTPTAAEKAALQLRHVVVAGFGVVGRAVCERFDTLGVVYTIIDFNPSTVSTQGALGRRVVFGDISNPEVLETAGVRSADAVILTIPDEDAVLRACEAVRAMNPSTFISARTNFLSKGMMASRLGADHVTVEELATAESMAHEVITQLTERVLRRHEREAQAATQAGEAKAAADGATTK